MKRAEEYLKDSIEKYIDDYDSPYYDEEMSIYDGRAFEIILAIKQAQEDAIRETVKECLNTCAYLNYPMEDNRRLCGEITTKESILSVVDKLIKEL